MRIKVPTYLEIDTCKEEVYSFCKPLALN